MLDTENTIELLSATETETAGDYEIYHFDQEEFEWDEIYDLGLELNAQVVGREESSETYFVSIKY
jgi:hypothetical protein